MEVPVTIHEQALAELWSAKRTIYQALSTTLPPAGTLRLTEMTEFFTMFNAEIEDVIESINMFGEKLANWRPQRRADTRKVIANAQKSARHIKLLTELRHHSLVINTQHDIRQVSLAVVDCILGDILAWVERYESIVRHPEAWQGRDINLMLVIQADKELEVLQRFLEGKGYAMDGGILVPASNQNRKGFGLTHLLAAFGLGLWLGDDDE